jgi:hypothetical protein
MARTLKGLRSLLSPPGHHFYPVEYWSEQFCYFNYTDSFKIISACGIWKTCHLTTIRDGDWEDISTYGMFQAFCSLNWTVSSGMWYISNPYPHIEQFSNIDSVSCSLARWCLFPVLLCRVNTTLYQIPAEIIDHLYADQTSIVSSVLNGSQNLPFNFDTF